MIYELRTYRIPPGRMPDILNRFETVTMRLFQKHGIEVVGFWTVAGEEHLVAAAGARTTRPDPNELVYLCRFRDAAACESAWASFRQDPEWLETRKRTEANGPIVAEVISQMMDPTGFSPVK
jgi:hypothetical protein